MTAFAFVLAFSTSVWAHANIDASRIGDQDRLFKRQAIGQLLLSMAPLQQVSRRPSRRTASAKLADTSSQYAVSQKLTPPSVDLEPRVVVENALDALSMQRTLTWLKFLDQHALRRRAELSQDPILKNGFQFKILSQFRKSADRYLFRVQANSRSAHSGFFGMHGTAHSRDYEVVVGRENFLETGRTVMHALDYQIGMVIGRDSSCEMDENWIEENGIDALPRGRMQPFYMLLPDARSANPNEIRYVAEDLLLKADMDHLFQNPLKETFLGKADDAKAEEDTRSAQEKEGCWLIHDIRPWD
jgi:hemimethylated DNA binding protein|mmetsp:Transcript_48599/g.76771  ORF Transcript_48599/g.76771 Transcript_48599/m.76771 type:complete len:301 (-) Transcript_48599:194-1096(-)